MMSVFIVSTQWLSFRFYRVALWWCSHNVFVILLIRVCLLITLIKYIKLLKVFFKCICLCHCHCVCVNQWQGHLLCCPQTLSGQLKKLRTFWKTNKSLLASMYGADLGCQGILSHLKLSYLGGTVGGDWTDKEIIWSQNQHWVNQHKK